MFFFVVFDVNCFWWCVFECVLLCVCVVDDVCVKLFVFVLCECVECGYDDVEVVKCCVVMFYLGYCDVMMMCVVWWL